MGERRLRASSWKAFELSGSDGGALWEGHGRDRGQRKNLKNPFYSGALWVSIHIVGPRGSVNLRPEPVLPDAAGPLLP